MSAGRRRGWGVGRAVGVVLLLLLPIPVGAAVPTGTDRTALEALYTATDGANWTDSMNWNTDTGDWHGVTTDEDGNVTYLILNNNNLSGTIPPALGSLSNLAYLDLSSNTLSGPHPAGIEAVDRAHRTVPRLQHPERADSA